jgi:hypothetical protein
MPLKVSISEDSVAKPFSFVSKCKDLEDALQKCSATLSTSSASSSSSNFVLLTTKSGKVLIAGLCSDTFIVALVDGAKADSVGCFAFELDRFAGILKNRSELRFTYTEDQKLDFKATKGAYNGSVVTLPITDDMVLLLNDTFSSKKVETSAEISPEILSLIREGLNLTAVKDVFNDNPMSSYIVLSKNSLTVSGVEKHHFGYYEASVKYKGSPFSISTPIKHFQLVDKLLAGSSEASNFSLQKETLRVDSEKFIVVLPLMQADERSFSMIPDFLKEVGKLTATMDLDLGDLSRVVDNLFPLYTVNTSIDFSYKEGTDKLKLTLSSNSGTASDVLKVQTKSAKAFATKVNPKVLRDSILLIKLLSNASLKVKGDKFIILTGSTASEATVTHVCSLV